MRRTIRPILAIASTTARELAGQPAIMLLVLAGMLLTAFVPLLHFHDFGEPGRICRDGGLAYQLVIGTLVAVASTAASIHGELANGTALAALGKPVSRGAFLVGKWLGAFAVVARFWFCVLASSLVAWRVPQRFTDFGDEGMGYVVDSAAQCALLLLPAAALAVGGFLHNRLRRRFCPTVLATATWLSAALLAACVLFDRQWRLAPAAANIDAAAVPAALLVLFALAANSAFAAALSTRLPAAPVLVASLLLVAAGLSWDSITAAAPPLALLPVPNLQSFWMCDALAGGGALPRGYLPVALAYTLASVAVALGAGILLFRRRDLS